MKLIFLSCTSFYIDKAKLFFSFFFRFGLFGICSKGETEICLYGVLSTRLRELESEMNKDVLLDFDPVTRLMEGLKTTRCSWSSPGEYKAV